MQLLMKGFLLLSEFVNVGKYYATEDRKHLFGNVIVNSSKSCSDCISQHNLIGKMTSMLKSIRPNTAVGIHYEPQ